MKITVVATDTISGEQAFSWRKGIAVGATLMSQQEGGGGDGAVGGDISEAEDSPDKEVKDKTKIEPGRDIQAPEKTKNLRSKQSSGNHQLVAETARFRD
jgi:hypothetical protein